MGADCTESKQDAQGRVKEESTSAGIAWGVTVSLVLVGVIIFILMYYRRQIRDLKTNIADVEYHANPQTQPDRHHFDNPVYAFQSPPNNTDNTKLLNNLKTNKSTNLDRYKLGFSDNESNASSRGELSTIFVEFPWEAKFFSFNFCSSFIEFQHRHKPEELSCGYDKSKCLPIYR